MNLSDRLFAVMLSFWECGHVEVEDGTSHECDGRDVCVAEWKNYVPASQLAGAVRTLERIRDHANSVDDPALLAQNELNRIKGTR